MKTKTELDPKFEFKNDREFAREILIGMLLSFATGSIIGTAIIMGIMSILDKL